MPKKFDFKLIKVKVFINKKCSEAVTTILQPENADIKQSPLTKTKKKQKSSCEV